MSAEFAERVHVTVAAKGSDLCLWLRPTLREMPLPIQKFDDPFLPFSRAVINATHAVVCAYLFDLAAYMALGAAGTVALERSIAHAAAQRDVLTILHGPFYGPNYATASANLAFNVGAVTILRPEDAPAYHALGVEALLFGPAPAGTISTIGRFDPDQSRVSAARGNGAGEVSLRVIAEDALGRGYDDDFPEKARARLESLR